MKPEPETPPLRDEELFELLERPEAWPEDPETQARLAELLELHLALRGHGPELQVRTSSARRWSGFQSPWLMAAAAALLALVPATYAVQRGRALTQQAKDRAHIQAAAQRRGQERLWMAFFQQSSDLLKQFDQQPSICTAEREDRNPERDLAVALLQASHQLAAQGAPNPEAELARTSLHAWLMELSMEDGCMEPARAEELREWAATHNLEDESQRLGQLLRGEAP